MFKSHWREEKEGREAKTRALGIVLIVLMVLGVIVAGHFWGYPVEL